MQHTKLPPYGELEEDHHTDPRYWSKDQREAAKYLDRPRKWKDMGSITDECSPGSYYGAVCNYKRNWDTDTLRKRTPSFSRIDYGED